MSGIMRVEAGSGTTRQDTASPSHQPTALIVFGLKISLSLLAEVAGERGLMWGGQAPLH